MSQRQLVGPQLNFSLVNKICDERFMYLLVSLISDTRLNDRNTNITPDGPEVSGITLAGSKRCLLMLAS